MAVTDSAPEPLPAPHGERPSGPAVRVGAARADRQATRDLPTAPVPASCAAPAPTRVEAAVARSRR
ncbi:hypothetical protein GTY65_24815 [Streptomyces sp. SID8379]|uniref:hypothetical protein n=1 Tax=unclassified Streptomyces TaxID=2593676 RepID=UPI00035FFC90|nr:MULTISPECIES: hypothetical protein [unclassified Streptomyces]MYW67263.1 hypothetical protein [Streptomyces sp. SID8379]